MKVARGVTAIRLEHPLMKTGVNSYLVEGEHLYVIDTGLKDTVDKLTSEIASNGFSVQEISLILNTHAHDDHSGGNLALEESSGAVVAIHEIESRKLVTLKPPRLLRDGDALSIGDRKLQVIHSPGHTPGGICLYEQVDRLLFAGDHIVEGTSTGTVYIGPPEGNVRDYIGSLKKIQQLDMKLILPGHGRVIEDPQSKIREILDHHAQRERQLMDVLRSGEKSTEEIAQVIYRGVASGNMAIGAVLGRLEKLVEDGLVEDEIRNERRYFKLK